MVSKFLLVSILFQIILSLKILNVLNLFDTRIEEHFEILFWTKFDLKK